ncbi:uncharacterized protein JN550_002415 [Neoarthrinium moseri]|uniref:uncharacterized protein n=1 Tax=Neoarthrinium moseri TaxID=1658444 RepID=UPI001FDE4445|nr:uncharacterized protein JN550_002415 [Neoarthrinium moseri]KAI1874986.1 hypothetical protein JN550_002415 [Neoarthrinium moseri]
MSGQPNFGQPAPGWPYPHQPHQQQRLQHGAYPYVDGHAMGYGPPPPQQQWQSYNQYPPPPAPNGVMPQGHHQIPQLPYRPPFADRAPVYPPIFPQNQTLIPRVLAVQKSGSKSYTLVNIDNGQVLYSVHFSSTRIQFSRFVNGPQCGSAKFHTFSKKIDLEIGNGHVTFKDEFQSTTGQGFLRWNKKYDSWLSGRGHLALESDGYKAAIYHLDKGPDHHDRQGGRFEILKQGLNQAQLDEVVISGIAYLEQRKTQAQAGIANAIDTVMTA